MKKLMEILRYAPIVRRKAVSILGPVAVFWIFFLAWTFTPSIRHIVGITAQASPVDASPSRASLMIPFVIGSLCAIAWKAFAGGTKNFVGKTFDWKALLVPVGLSVLLSIPIVLIYMPLFGKPTRVFSSDSFSAYVTTFTMIDLCKELYEIREIVRSLRAVAKK